MAIRRHGIGLAEHLTAVGAYGGGILEAAAAGRGPAPPALRTARPDSVPMSLSFVYVLPLIASAWYLAR